jgi:hypothetical protein
MIQQRCVNHEFREAASRCPVCLRYFCRECVTEHEDRVLCAECLKKVIARENARSSAGRSLMRGLLPIAGLLMAWLFFYAIGRTLLLIPSAVHDGTIWESR